ncbi:MAG: ribonuclease HII [Candidatus Dojkabacteria bacterium]|nr:MAG: ribonuclease HII [Candidatus Dojkabacteria bacterium]
MKYPSFFLEYHALQIHSAIAGVDEVGRGCLFGPVVAGIVVLTNEKQYIPQVRDSKTLSELQRTILSSQIKETVPAFGLGEASATEIDTFGIRKATQLAMMRAYWQLSLQPEVLLMDGEKATIPFLGKTFQFTKGDLNHYSIAAASVIAKVYRDNLISSMSEEFPEYSLSSNKGYGTAAHMKALREHGATPLHRKSFLSFLS